MAAGATTSKLVEAGVGRVGWGRPRWTVDEDPPPTKQAEEGEANRVRDPVQPCHLPHGQGGRSHVVADRPLHGEQHGYDHGGGRDTEQNTGGHVGGGWHDVARHHPDGRVQTRRQQDRSDDLQLADPDEPRAISGGAAETATRPVPSRRRRVAWRHVRSA